LYKGRSDSSNRRFYGSISDALNEREETLVSLITKLPAGQTVLEFEGHKFWVDITEKPKFEMRVGMVPEGDDPELVVKLMAALEEGSKWKKNKDGSWKCVDESGSSTDGMHRTKH
jgi:hypothetical protein